MPGGVREIVAAHPVILGIFMVCIGTGAVLGFVFLSGDWSVVRRLAAGVVGGAGVALILTTPRMIG